MLHNEALKYNSNKEFRNNSKTAYNLSLRRGINKDICLHMEKGNTNWTIELLQKEANKYNYRGEFQLNSFNAYDSAKSRGLLDAICSHMKSKYKTWTDDRIKEEASKYETIDEFRKLSSGAYQSAKYRKIMANVTSHMHKKMSDNDTIYIYNTKEMPSVYKIGVTSNRLGTQRIQQVLEASGLSLGDRFEMFSVDNGYSTEKKISDLFKLKSYKFKEKFNGSSEFYMLNDVDYKVVCAISSSS